MAKRIKLPTIKPEKRLEWLKRVEKGETPPQIAGVDHVDVRTVRKHVDMARMERDVQQARSVVLQNALEGHYRDLLEMVRTVQGQVTAEAPVSSEKDTPLMYGLHQHMPRSVLFENLKKWNRNLDEIEEQQKAIRANIQKEIDFDGRLKGIISRGANGVVNAAIEVLLHQVNEWARGREGLNIDRDIHLEKGEGGNVIMRYGFSSFGEIERENVETIKDVLRGLESKLKEMPGFSELETFFNRMNRLKGSIREVITTILLRRIVPGKCKYCPL